MAINLQDYETVEERIRRFYKDHPEARIITDLVSVEGEPGWSRWVMKAYVYKDAEREKPDSTGYAFEIDGAGIAQRAAALETCETSAIGRALANLNYSGNKRASREEMMKAVRADSDKSGWLQKAASAPSVEAVKQIWSAAQQAGAPQDVLDKIRMQATGKK